MGKILTQFVHTNLKTMYLFFALKEEKLQPTNDFPCKNQKEIKQMPDCTTKIWTPIRFFGLEAMRSELF